MNIWQMYIVNITLMSHSKPHPSWNIKKKLLEIGRYTYYNYLSYIYSNIRVMSRMGVAMHGVDGGMGVAVGVTCLEWMRPSLPFHIT